MMQETDLVSTINSSVVTLSSLQVVIAQPCGQHEVYRGRGGEDLIRQDQGLIIFWNSHKLKKMLLYSQMNREVNTLYLNWAPTSTYPVVTVIFQNDDVAHYYSKDGQYCDVTINAPAADVKSVTARA